MVSCFKSEYCAKVFGHHQICYFASANMTIYIYFILYLERK